VDFQRTWGYIPEDRHFPEYCSTPQRDIFRLNLKIKSIQGNGYVPKQI
jgi:hypothetical protein